MNVFPFRLGLTGSIGTGKTTTARMFLDKGIPVWDADATVHDLYRTGHETTRQIGVLWPAALLKNGVVSRPKLREIIRRSPENLKILNNIVHPEVQKRRSVFLAEVTSDIVVLDIPLLFETGEEKNCDAVVVVTIPWEEQRRRIFARSTMSEDDLRFILAQQMPDDEKRRRADYIIETKDMATAQASVQNIIRDIREKMEK